MLIIPLDQRKPGAAAVGTGEFLGDGVKNTPAQLPQADTTLNPVAQSVTPPVVTPMQSLAEKNRAGQEAFATKMASTPTTGLTGKVAMGGVEPVNPVAPVTPVATQPVTSTSQQANASMVSPKTTEQAYASGITAAEQSAQGKAIGTSYQNDATGVRTASDLLIEKQNLGNATANADKQRSEAFKQSTLQQEARTRGTLGQINAMRMRMGSGTSQAFDQQLQEQYDMQKGVVGYLSTMNDIESQDALRAYDYSMTKLDNNYNDTVQKISNMAASQIKDAQAAGKLSTMADISAFRNNLAATFDEIAKTSLVFAQEKSRVSDYYKTVGDKMAEQNKLANEIDETASQQLGYLVNKRGQQYGNTKTPYVDYALQKALLIQQNSQDFTASQSQLDREQKLREQGLLPTGGLAASIQYGSGTTDFTSLAPKYPNVAAFKNNNPAGITWNSNFESGNGSAALLDKAGISYQIGTDRPQSEGGNYVKFNSIEDGLAAQRVIMTGTYGNSTVANMLSSWVGTPEGQAYAKQVASNAGINLNATINTLSPAQLDILQISKLQKESPGLYKELTNAGLVEGSTINFAKPQVFTQEDINAGNAPGIASEFMDSLNSGNFTVSSPSVGGKLYTPAQVTSFDAFSKSNDQKDLIKNGLSVGDYNVYKMSQELSYEDQTKIQRALSIVPAQLRNSDTESARYINTAKLGLKAGFTPQQIADEFLGFTIDNKAVVPFAQKLRNTYNSLANSKTEEVKIIAQLINAKDYDGATRKVENTAYASLGADQQGMENNVAKYVRAFDRINNFVSNNPDKIGPIQGYFAGGMKNWTGDASISEALADMATLNSQLVNQNVKGVPSDIDTKMLSQSFSTLTSGESNITGVLQQTKNEMINSLNADRSRLGLPELTDKDVGNYKDRASLYMGEKREVKPTTGPKTYKNYF